MAGIMNKPIGRRSFIGGTLAAGSAAAFAGLGLAGCSGGEGGGGASGGTVMRHYTNEPVAIDPYNAQETQGVAIVSALFDPLTVYNYETEELEGAAAESWEPNEDATVFTFHLREGATFHNGDPVDAASFKRAWERMASPNTSDTPSAISYHLSMIQGYDEVLAGDAEEMSGIACPDDLTLVVTLSQPYADFPYVASHPSLAPVPQAATDDFQTYFEAPIGNGPFKMDGKWEHNQYINVVRFDDYYGEKAKIDGINFVVYDAIDTAYREFQAGSLDVCEIPNASIQEAYDTYGISEDGFTGTPDHQCLNGNEVSTYFIVCNTEVEPFNDPMFRRAISLAINREAICSTVYNDTRVPAANVVAPGIEGYIEGEWTYSHYDVAEAERILDELGYTKDANGSRGLDLQLSFNPDGDHQSIMECVMSDLQNIGINCTGDTSDWGTILSRMTAGDYQFGRLGWTADYPILDNFLYPLFYTGNGDNRAHYSNPEVDAAMDAARQTVDLDARIAALQEVNRQIAEDMPVIPIFYYNHTTVVGERVQSYYKDPAMIPGFETAEMTA